MVTGNFKAIPAFLGGSGGYQFCLKTGNHLVTGNPNAVGALGVLAASLLPRSSSSRTALLLCLAPPL